MQQVQVRVSEEGALRNGRFAFADRCTLVSELLQNARRAGAALIRIDHDADRRTLTVVDDGHGIDDFQQLLTFNESGWDAATIDHEHAFGIGFSKALYSARFVSVTSQGRRLAFRTEDALARHRLDVVAGADGDPMLTVVRLDGVDLPELRDRIGRLCCGFPVPVSFNGTLVPRPYALDALAYTETPIGRVHLDGFHCGRRSLDTLLFLQGQIVNLPPYWCDGHCDVVHLDQRRFLARLPDRAQLIDSAEQLRVIDAAIRSLWRAVLERRKAKLGGKTFVDWFFELACRQGHQDLFNDVPLLPRQACDLIVDYPARAGDAALYTRAPARHFGRDEVERGDVRLACLDDPDENNIAHWMYARARNIVLVRSYRLHDEHWAQAHVRDLGREPVEVTIDGELQRVSFEGRCVFQPVVLCKSYSLVAGDDKVDITDEAIAHGDRIIVPAGETTGRVAGQASSYLDENDKLRDDDLAADEQELARLFKRLRADDPVKALASLLDEASLGQYPMLAGRTFRVTVGAHDSGCSVDVIELS